MAKGTRASDKHSGAAPKAETNSADGLPRNDVHRAFPIRSRLFGKLKRRNVVRVALLYLVACWVVLEPTHAVFHMLEVPVWANRLVILLMVIGFPLVLLFSWIYEVTPEGLKPIAEVDPAKSITHKTGQKLNQAIIIALALAVVVLLTDKFWLSRRPNAAGSPQAAFKEGADSAATSPADHPLTGKVDAVSGKSIAVLPFADMSEKKDQEYFSDGLAAELIDQLAKVPQLQVTARTSSFSFKNKSDDVPTIARKLNVANILEGSVRKSGVRLRVTTELIQADSGKDIWSETYDQELKDVFKVQDDIAAAVVAALKVHLLPSQKLPSSQRTQNTEAYNQYLLGRQFYARRTLEDWRRAIKAYREAIELDPNFAAAHAGLAFAEFWEADQTGDNAGYDRAMASAEKAVALAPEEVEGYTARGYLRTIVSWDWAGAQADLLKALALDPGSSDTQSAFANVLLSLGRLPEAIATVEKAAQLDPLSSATWEDLARSLMAAGRLAAAHDPIRHALEISPDNYLARTALGDLQLLEGKASEAAVTYHTVSADDFRLYGTAMAEHSLGHARESQLALEDLIAKYAQGGAYQVAEVYAWRGEKDKAFEWLERAYRQRDSGLASMKSDPLIVGLHGDPRFSAFLRKMKLAE